MSKVTTGLWQNIHDGKYIKVRGMSCVILDMVDCNNEGCAKVYSLSIQDLLDNYKLRESDTKRDRLAQVKQSSGIPKTLARHGSLDEYVDSLPAYEGRSVGDYEVGSVWRYRELQPVAISSVDEYKAYFIVDGEERSTPKVELKTPDWKCLWRAPVVDDTFNDDTPAQMFSDIKWDMGTDEKREAILVTVCSKCGSTVPADSVAKPALSRWAARFLLALAAICFAFLFSILALVLFEQLDIDHIFFKAVAFITTLGFLFLFLYFYLSEEVSE